MSILISVIVPTYRRPHLLAQCLNALLHQTFDSRHYEIIIVSDGPDDATRDAVARYDRPERLFCAALPAKGGPAAARNYGWRRSKGKLVVFTDDDCLPCNDWLVTLWNVYAAARLDAIALTGRIIVPLPEPPTDYARNVANLETAEFVTANCACSRRVLDDVGGFDEAFTMAWREDSDLHFKILENGVPLIHVPKAIVTHPVRAARWGVSIHEERKGLFNALLYKKYPRLYRKKISDRIPWQYYMIVLSFAVGIVGFAFGLREVSWAGLICWAILTVNFIGKRLRLTSNSFTHVSEMIVTSLFIPFLSIYWRIYGSLKFKVLFIR